MAGHPELIGSDGFHPNAAGHQYLAERIGPLIRNALQPSRRWLAPKPALLRGSPTPPTPVAALRREAPRGRQAHAARPRARHPSHRDAMRRAVRVGATRRDRRSSRSDDRRDPLRRDRPPCRRLEPSGRRAVAAVDELVDGRRVEDATWAVLAARYSTEQLIELTMLAGRGDAMTAVILFTSSVIGELPPPPNAGRSWPHSGVRTPALRDRVGRAATPTARNVLPRPTTARRRPR